MPQHHRSAQRRSLLRPWIGWGLLCWALTSGSALAQEDVLGRSLEDLQSGNAVAAYERLQVLEARHAGDPDFDFLLGISALASGRGTEAIFALERVLAMRPDDVNARVAMGRAHLALQETESARREFQTAQALDGSPRTQAAVQRYLTAVDQIEAASRFAARIYMEFGLGYDTNVNSASRADQVAIPALGGVNFNLSNTAQARDDAFVHIAGGLNFRTRLSARSSLTGGIGFTQRFLSKETEYETTVMDASLGLSHARTADTFGANLQVSLIQVNDDDYAQGYRDSVGSTLYWLHNLSGSTQLSSYYQYAWLSYPNQEARDADRHVVGAALGTGFDIGLSGFLSAYLGREETHDPEFRRLGHDPVGVRVGGDYPFSQHLSGFANASYEFRTYRAEDPLFLYTRRDHQYGAALGFNYLLQEKGWRLVPQLSYLRVHSNIPINQYERLQVQLVMRGDF